MILNDYKCLAHGYFEAWEPKCPKGCDGEAVVKVFLQAVGTRSDSTRHADSTLQGLAKEYGMSDIKSVREGEAQPARFGQQQRQQQNPYAVQWGDPKQIAGYNTAPIADESVNGLQLARDTGRLSSLKPAVVQHDHENLSIQK